MKLFIASCPKSGTHYTTAFLNALDINVEHEGLGLDGTVSWILDRVKNEDEHIVLHQTREPLATISSLQYLSKDSWKYIHKTLQIQPSTPLIQKCMLMYYQWHKNLDNCIFTYPVEDISELISILELFKIPLNKNKLNLALKIEKLGATNNKNHLQWKDLLAIDKPLTKKIERLAKKYGY